MGLIASGMSTREPAWTKRKIYWTYQRMSELFSMVSFEGVSTASVFDESIKTYKFQRPGLEPIVFAFLANPESVPRERPQLFKQPFTYYQLVGRDDGISAQSMVGITVQPGERDKAAKFIEDLVAGPVAIVFGNTTSLSSRFGVFDNVGQGCLDGSSCSQYYSEKALNDFGTSWMIVRPDVAFMNNPQGWIGNDKVVTEMVARKIDPIADISPFDDMDDSQYANVVGQIAERYDSDGLSDVASSYNISKFLMTPGMDESSGDFAKQVLECGRRLRSVNRNAMLIIGGGRDKTFWQSVFEALQSQKNTVDKKIFDVFDIPAFASSVSDKDGNSKALLTAINEYTKLLSDNKLGYAKIATMQLSTYTGQPSGKQNQTENEQAAELARLYTLASASKSTLIGWDGKQSAQYQLFKSRRVKKTGRMDT